jgi:hypothetical protein
MGKLIRHSMAKEAVVRLGALLLCSGSCLLAAEPAAPAPPPPIEPSRYAGDQLDEYLKTVTGILHATSRTTDPFGLMQDPEAKPAVRRSPVSTAPAEIVVPFSDIVPLIRITTVIAAEKKFLVESRAFSQGEEFPLNFRGKQLRILITEVSSRQVQFKNLATGEIAARRLDLLPPGMSAGGAGSAPPGMTATGADAPLVIEPEESAQPAR